MDTRNNTILFFVYSTLAAFIWAACPVLSKQSCKRLPPWDLTALRFGLTGTLLTPFSLRRRVEGIRWRRAMILAVGAGASYLPVMGAGLNLLPAGHTGVIEPSNTLLF